MIRSRIFRGAGLAASERPGPQETGRHDERQNLADVGLGGSAPKRLQQSGRGARSRAGTGTPCPNAGLRANASLEGRAGGDGTFGPCYIARLGRFAHRSRRGRPCGIGRAASELPEPRPVVAGSVTPGRPAPDRVSSRRRRTIPRTEEGVSPASLEAVARGPRMNPPCRASPEIQQTGIAHVPSTRCIEETTQGGGKRTEEPCGDKAGIQQRSGLAPKPRQVGPDDVGRFVRDDQRAQSLRTCRRQQHSDRRALQPDLRRQALHPTAHPPRRPAPPPAHARAGRLPARPSCAGPPGPRSSIPGVCPITPSSPTPAARSTSIR